GGTAIGNWIKLFPYENEHDARGTDQFANCTFDPTDDGSTEDDFFSPEDPARRKGPSSTCDPEFNFVFHGDTDYRANPPDTSKIGRAFDGPGYRGQAGPGTWVQPKFALGQYKGRRLRLRFLGTSIEVDGAATYNDTNIGEDNEVGDDGWYIDRIVVSNTLSSPATLSADETVRTPQGCVECTTVTAVLDSSPPAGPAPGQPVNLRAGGSSADSCLNGALQYRFFIDENNNGAYDPDTEPLLRDWTDNANLLDAPLVDTNYGVSVRCSSTPACQSSTTNFVAVDCPSTKAYFQQVLYVENGQARWSRAESVDAVQVNLNTLRSQGSYDTATETCLANDQDTNSIPWDPAVNPGQAKGVLVRKNDPQATWGAVSANECNNGVRGEAPGRDEQITICP
ncbi:MAG: hypothetical protein VKI81_11855, partial [Synechococcaceae cyanobacterium]|nr:hypothetical protein [Synechococcaceae cyanobacterium]